MPPECKKVQNGGGGRVYDSLPAINVPGIVGRGGVSRDGNTREPCIHACLVGRRIASHKVGGYGCPEPGERLVDKQLRWNPQIRGQIRIPRFGAPIGSTRGPSAHLLPPLAPLSSVLSVSLPAGSHGTMPLPLKQRRPRASCSYLTSREFAVRALTSNNYRARRGGDSASRGVAR